MKQYWSKKARAITPYVAGEQPKMQNLIKLNTNENPYPPSPQVSAAIAGVDTAAMRLYPQPDSDGLRAALAAHHGLAPENVFCGNGSDDVLAIAFQSFFDGGLAIADVTYSFYSVWAELFGISCEIIPLLPDFSIDVEGFLGRRCAVLPNPNAPTSMALGLADIERIVASAEGVVILDEAYIAFGGESAVPLLSKYDNLLVVRTFSKSHALAGLRVGYALGNPDLIEAMRAIKDSFNSYPVDQLAQAAAIAAIQDEAYTRQTVAQIVRDRAYTTEGLQALGFDVLPPAGNFVFCRHPKTGGAALMAGLRERGIVVRRFDAPRIADYLRITIGTHAQMETLLTTLKALV